MMQIIKHGDRYHIATCPRCGCNFGFAHLEIDVEEGDFSRTESINCPECGRKISRTGYRIDPSRYDLGFDMGDWK